ncbi:hypothetical protein KIPB_014268, partial [Kipferlia bialata]|eukprot:g14268.t1
MGVRVPEFLTKWMWASVEAEVDMPWDELWAHYCAPGLAAFGASLILWLVVSASATLS